MNDLMVVLAEATEAVDGRGSWEAEVAVGPTGVVENERAAA